MFFGFLDFLGFCTVPSHGSKGITTFSLGLEVLALAGADT